MIQTFHTYFHKSFHTFKHGRMIYKDTKPYTSTLRHVFNRFYRLESGDTFTQWLVFSTQVVNRFLHGRRKYEDTIP